LKKLPEQHKNIRINKKKKNDSNKLTSNIAVSKEPVKELANDIIVVTNLRKEFDKLVAVDNISFSVKQGEIFGFLGPNGAGKSTTIKMLTTLLKPTSGNILIVNHDPATEPHEVRKTFGIVFQDQSLDDELTAYENMSFHGILFGVPKEIRTARIEQLMKIVELWDRKDSLVKHFSGGMRRRLEIARGLLHHPKILFLDEPTIGLDPQTRNHIWQHIAELNKSENITVFFTTHYMDEAEKMADRIAIIDDGKVIMQGSPKEIMKLTKTKNLEDAFIKVTGNKIRAEEGTSLEQMRMRRNMGR
jgi:ABC-2 type transport system ATP-binding protein